MSETVHLEFRSPPPPLTLLPKVVLARRPSLVPTSRSVPRIEVNVAQVGIDPAHVARYNDVCGFPAAQHVPITYPHVLASSLHLALVTADAFPVRLFGLVHLRNRITQYSPVPLNGTIGVRCFLEGYRDTERGHEFDLITEARSGEAVLWQETMTMLARRPRPPSSGKTPPRAGEELSAATTVSFRVPADIGRRYAMISGDFNPIHLSMPTARLFGFPKAIAHGMWSLARCIAEIGGFDASRPLTLNCAFKLPVLLPAWVMLCYAGQNGAGRFELRDHLGEKPHLTGSLSSDAAS